MSKSLYLHIMQFFPKKDISIFLNEPTPASISFIFVFSTTHYKFYKK